MNKKQTGIRLSEAAQQIIEKYSQELGVSKTAIVELALREFDKVKTDGKKVNNS